MERTKILVISDGVAPTGFSRVSHSVFSQFSKEKYHIKWIAVNFKGDPHPYMDMEIYPAILGGDVYGMKRIREFVDWHPDIIFILNDAWIQNDYLRIIKELFTKDMPKIITYTPVDAADHDPEWYVNFDIVSEVVTYTEFGKKVIEQALPEREIKVIPHGVGPEFYQLQHSKNKIKTTLFPKINQDEVLDSFIVLNANRNQPRKRIDITVEAFSIFAKDKPMNVKLYLHMGVIDASYDIIKLCTRFGIRNRLILTSIQQGIQDVPVERLNLIYNACDVGINTGLGEGWGLCQIEHAVTGAPQVVAGHSALKELYSDCGVLVEPKSDYILTDIMTTGKIVAPTDVAEKLELLYTDRKLYQELSAKSIAKFRSEEYSWKSISERWQKLFDEVLEK